MTDLPQEHKTTPKHPRGLATLVLALLVLWGPAYRALLDKLWAITGGMSLVGQWAQLQNVMDLIAAPTFVGVGMGLTVLVAQRDHQQHQPLLVAAMLLGLLTALPVVALAFIFPDQLTTLLGFAQNQSRLVPLAAVAGYLGIALGVLNGYWLGQRHTGKVLLASVVAALPAIAYLLFTVDASAGPDPATLLQVVILTHLLVVAILLERIWRWHKTQPGIRTQVTAALKPLAPFILSGLATGILTPLSGIVIRAAMADQMDWAAAGAATALWRTSEWVHSSCYSILYYHFLPRLSLNAADGTLPQGLKLATYRVVLPGCLLLILLFMFQQPILSLLYTADLDVPRSVSALFWGGDALRMFAGLLLFGLYALHANRAIALGEWLSQPLLALLLALGAANTLLGVGLAHLSTYLIFVALNLWLLHKIWTSFRKFSISGHA